MLVEVEAALLFVLAVIGSAAAIFAVHGELVSEMEGRLTRRGMAVSCCQLVGGAVLVGSAILHLLPESREEEHEHHDESGDGDGEEHAHVHSVSLGDCVFLATLLGWLLLERAILPQIQEMMFNVRSRASIINVANHTDFQSLEDSQTVPKIRHHHGHAHHSHTPQHGHSHAPVVPRTCRVSVSSRTSIFSEPGEMPWHAVAVLWVTLSIHSVLEGVALGVSKGSSSHTSILVAICLHKSLEAFALAVSLRRSSHSRLRTQILFLVLFALCTPVGTVIGYHTKSIDHSGTANRILNAISAGTFVFVGLVEIIMEELGRTQESLAFTLCQAMALTGGVCAIALAI